MNLLLLIASGVLLAAHPSQTKSTQDEGKRLPADLRERYIGAMRELKVPGMAVVIVRGNEVIHLDALGIRDPEGSKPVTPDTMFYIASCTKPFTATVVAQLAQAGKVDLDAPVKRYLPRFQIADEELTEKLTVRDLLTHKQGLNSRPIVFLDAFTGEINEDRFYHFLKEVKPTKKFGYSNLHFTLAGRLVEGFEGKGWREALEDRLFKPAGMMRTTGYASRIYNDPDSAIPLESKGDSWVPCAVRKTDRTMHAAGGTGTTARDLGRWLRLNLGNGEIDGVRILPPDALKEMHKLQMAAVRKTSVADYQIEGHGLGWQVATYKGHQMIRHGGGYEGTAALIAFAPDKKIGVAVLCNSGVAAGPLTEVVVLDVFNRLIGIDGPDVLPLLIADFKKGEARASASPVTAPASLKELSLPPEAYAGTYANEHWGTIKIESKVGNLAVQIGDLPVTAKSTASDAFQFGSNVPFRDARFETQDKKVVAVIGRLSGQDEVRFDRKAK